MTIQPDRTPEQQAAACDTCDDDPTWAPGRYCPAAVCYCGHDSCPAFDPAKVLRHHRTESAKSGAAQPENGTLDGPGNRTAPAGNRGLTTATVEESKWL